MLPQLAVLRDIAPNRQAGTIRWIYHVFIFLYFQLKISYHLCSLTVGDGNDDFPFIISISSKAMLSMLLRANESLIPVVFHMDSTFKCNENEFSVTLLGIRFCEQTISSTIHQCCLSLYMWCLHLPDHISSRISSKGVTWQFSSVQILHDCLWDSREVCNSIFESIFVLCVSFPP